MKNCKKILSSVLALMMLCSMLCVPTIAFAAETETVLYEMDFQNARNWDGTNKTVLADGVDDDTSHWVSFDGTNKISFDSSKSDYLFNNDNYADHKIIKEADGNKYLQMKLEQGMNEATDVNISFPFSQSVADDYVLASMDIKIPATYNNSVTAVSGADNLGELRINFYNNAGEKLVMLKGNQSEGKFQFSDYDQSYFLSGEYKPTSGTRMYGNTAITTGISGDYFVNVKLLLNPQNKALSIFVNDIWQGDIRYLYSAINNSYSPEIAKMGIGHKRKDQLGEVSVDNIKATVPTEATVQSLLEKTKTTSVSDYHYASGYIVAETDMTFATGSDQWVGVTNTGSYTNNDWLYNYTASPKLITCYHIGTAKSSVLYYDETLSTPKNVAAEVNLADYLPASKFGDDGKMPLGTKINVKVIHDLNKRTSSLMIDDILIFQDTSAFVVSKDPANLPIYGQAAGLWGRTDQGITMENKTIKSITEKQAVNLIAGGLDKLMTANVENGRITKDSIILPNTKASARDLYMNDWYRVTNMYADSTYYEKTDGRTLNFNVTGDVKYQYAMWTANGGSVYYLKTANLTKDDVTTDSAVDFAKVYENTGYNAGSSGIMKANGYSQLAADIPVTVNVDIKKGDTTVNKKYELKFGRELVESEDADIKVGAPEYTKNGDVITFKSYIENAGSEQLFVVAAAYDSSDNYLASASAPLTTAGVDGLSTATLTLSGTDATSFANAKFFIWTKTGLAPIIDVIKK